MGPSVNPTTHHNTMGFPYIRVGGGCPSPALEKMHKNAQKMSKAEQEIGGGVQITTIARWASIGPVGLGVMCGFGVPCPLSMFIKSPYDLQNGVRMPATMTQRGADAPTLNARRDRRCRREAGMAGGRERKQHPARVSIVETLTDRSAESGSCEPNWSSSLNEKQTTNFNCTKHRTPPQKKSNPAAMAPPVMCRCRPKLWLWVFWMQRVLKENFCAGAKNGSRVATVQSR